VVEANLKNKTIFSMVWSAVQRFGTMTLSFVSNLMLARLLSPDDFGAVGMLAIFIALSTNFIDGGFGAALVQKTNPTQKDFSTIFYWNLSLAVVLYVIIWFSSPLIASFYKIDILSKLLRVQALILIINSLGLVQRTRLRKQLKFRKIAVVDLVASLLAVIGAISSAYGGLGVWSLVVYQLVLSCSQTIGLWTIHRWMPSLVFDIKSFKSLFKFGGFLLISDLLNTLCDNIQGLIIGRKFSPAVMGYYTQAKKLEEIPTTSLSNIVAQVTFPVFSELKGNSTALSVAHRKCLHAVNFINVPLMSLLIVIAQSLIVFLFTDKWLESVPYFRVLCVAGLANCLQSINYQLYVAMGHSKSMFKWNLLKRGIGLALIFIGAIVGIYGILWGMVIGFWFTYFVNARLAGRITGYTLRKQMSELLPILLITLFSCVVSYFVGSILSLHYALTMLIQVLSFIIVYILLSALFKIYAFDIYINIVQEALVSIRNKLNKK
jgi:O-antigen/teichoic acid export membrane protein